VGSASLVGSPNASGDAAEQLGKLIRDGYLDVTERRAAPAQELVLSRMRLDPVAERLQRAADDLVRRSAGPQRRLELGDDDLPDAPGDGAAQVLLVAEVAIQHGAADPGRCGDLLRTGVGPVAIDGRHAGIDEDGTAADPVLVPPLPSPVRRTCGLTHARSALGVTRCNTYRVSRCSVCLPQLGQNFFSVIRSGSLRRFLRVM
jgi:hypothetical protein